MRRFLKYINRVTVFVTVLAAVVVLGLGILLLARPQALLGLVKLAGLLMAAGGLGALGCLLVVFLK